jgi:membrane protein YqaA with SNARE-associated domain
MSEEIIASFGYIGLFFICFLGATLFPLGSEIFVVWMAMRGYHPGQIVLWATAGNYLGSLTNYYVGKWGGDFFLARFFRMDPATLEKAHRLYGRWGAPILLFSWAPVVGDALTLISGMLKLRLTVFSLWVLLGKGLRYVVVVWLALSTTR